MSDKQDDICAHELESLSDTARYCPRCNVVYWLDNEGNWRRPPSLVRLGPTLVKMQIGSRFFGKAVDPDYTF